MGADRDTISQRLGWNFFDKIYCITLESRPDRMREAKNQFALAGLDQRMEFIVVIKDEANPERGIYQSHLRCLSLGLEAGARHILVFEDDVFFRDFSAERLHQACLFLQATSAWDAFFLGCLTNGSRQIGQRAVVQVQYRCLAHAYAVNRAFAERIVREQWRGIPFDGLLQSCDARYFALRPMCAFQRLTSSDNKTVWLDKLRTLCGGLSIIQRYNEIYHNNKGLILALHLAVAATAIALFLFARQ
ncbi:hypothetical protein [uncultured Desulfobulbus sp.]|uniref:hypothetical protein n=1 Tax=uncultured Desulfobulbus sp. TaxID=239745 RepID=UPI0029C8F72C|nr:hypothetical protein [uncultured Desulfobulbus sp.]